MPTRSRSAAAPSARIAYAIAPTSFGFVLVAANERGVCFSHLADRPESLLRDLRERYPDADFIENDRKVAGYARKIVAAWNAPGRGCDVPIDLQGTAFQLAVWNAILKIPAGRTASYADIARQIGRPNAGRAVGNACGKNPVSPIVPCHRVIASDGSLGGYGHRLNIKQTLLDRER